MSDTFDELMNGSDEVESFLKGNKAGFKVPVPETIDVKKIRSRLKMTQSKFLMLSVSASMP